MHDRLDDGEQLLPRLRPTWLRAMCAQPSRKLLFGPLLRIYHRSAQVRDRVRLECHFMDERLLLGLDIPPVGSEVACCREVDDADGGAWTCCGNMSPPYIAHAETTPIMPAKPGVLVSQSHSRMTSLRSASGGGSQRHIPQKAVLD